MALNQRQLSLHWREFSAAKRACLAAGHPEPDRHELYVKAGVLAGPARAKSLTKFNNGDLDKVLAVFRALISPSDLEPQLNADRQVRIRLEYSIRELASKITSKPVHFADAYWRAIAHDKFGLHYPADSAVRVQFSELADLSIEQLTQLRNTLDDRLTRSHKKETLARRAEKKKQPPEPTESRLSLFPASNEEPKMDMADDNAPF